MKNIKAILMLGLTLSSCFTPQLRLPQVTNFNTQSDASTISDVDLSMYHDISLAPFDASVIRGSEDSGETITPLRMGQAAPFPGVLFNGPAVARVEVEFRGLQTQCRIERQTDLNRLAARAIADINSLQTTLNTTTATFLLRTRTQQEELNQLYRITRDYHLTSPWLYIGLGAGGFVLGIIASLLVAIGIR